MSDLFEDLVDAFGPDEGFWIGVVVIDIKLDGLDEIGDALEGSASDAFGDFSKPTLHEVKPRGTRWDKVQMEARVFFYPAFDAGMLMGCVIVDDKMQVGGFYITPRKGSIQDHATKAVSVSATLTGSGCLQNSLRPYRLTAAAMRPRKPVSLMPRLAATALLVRQQVERGAWRCNR